MSEEPKEDCGEQDRVLMHSGFIKTEKNKTHAKQNSPVACS